jgi:hypothetical protein
VDLAPGGHESSSQRIAPMAASVSSSLERRLHLGVEDLSMEARGDLRPALPLEFDGAAPVDPVGTDPSGDDVPREAGNAEPSILLDAGEPLVLVEAKIREVARPLDPRAELPRVDLRGGLGEQPRRAGPLARALKRVATLTSRSVRTWCSWRAGSPGRLWRAWRRGGLPWSPG